VINYELAKQQILIAVLFALSIPMLGQTAPVQSAQPQPLQMQDHPQHATEKSLQTDGSTVTASGTLPLSDFCTAPDEPQPSLGEIARDYRNGHAVPRPIIRVIP
jgi:hypothetical protein